jgi:hypothetical protein
MLSKPISIYALIDGKNRVHYVGATMRSLKIRFSGHRKTERACGVSLKIILLEKTNSSFDEVIWIQFFLRRKHPIKNISGTTLGCGWNEPKDREFLRTSFLKCETKFQKALS